ncbi:hypothetical protein C6A85_16540, partial [Mycobacterium sp. ITM-2017-0098]
EREAAGAPASPTRFGGACERLADRVEKPGIGSQVRPRGASDRPSGHRGPAADRTHPAVEPGYLYRAFRRGPQGVRRHRRSGS